MNLDKRLNNLPNDTIIHKVPDGWLLVPSDFDEGVVRAKTIQELLEKYEKQLHSR